MPEHTDWLRPALAVVAAVTVARIVLLAFNRTDLFVDESQYWLWGRNLDFGYYSKPPLIAWVIRAVTTLAQSDAPFWVRLPGAVFHAATALILGALGARIAGGRAAFWIAVSYVTVPFAALGSLLISTDTIMAPFFAGALYLWFRALEERRAGLASVAGFAVGMAFLAKYAALYFLLGAGLAALVVPGMRGTPRLWTAMLGAFALTVLPNVIWNLSHQLTTVQHTMDNIGWVRDDAPARKADAGRMADFFGSQFAVFGPVLFAAFLWAVLRARSPQNRALVAFALPVLALVCVQALLSKAYANWAVATYFAGIVLAVPLIVQHAPRLMALSVAINGAIALALPLLTVLAPWPMRGDQPLLNRYLGRAALSQQIIALAQARGASTVMARERDVLADLFYTGRDAGLRYRAPRPAGRPMDYYEQTFAVAPDDGPVLAVLSAPPICGGFEQLPVGHIKTAGAFAKYRFDAYLIGGDCAATLR